MDPIAPVRNDGVDGDVAAAPRPASPTHVAVPAIVGAPSPGPGDGARADAGDGTEAAASPDACLACGTGLVGAYCHGCGERRSRADDLHLRRFWRLLASEVTDLDSKLFTTLRLLMLKPGALTVEFVRGARGTQVGPVKLFIALFAAALLLGEVPVIERAVEASAAGQAFAAQERVAAGIIAAATGEAASAVTPRLREAWSDYQSWLRGLIVLLFALATWAMYLRRRRPFVEHVVFALHFGAFNYALASLWLPVVTLMRAASPGMEGLLQVPVTAAVTVYIYQAVRRVYGQGRVVSALKGLVLLFLFAASQMVEAVVSLNLAIWSLLPG